MKTLGTRKSKKARSHGHTAMFIDLSRCPKYVVVHLPYRTSSFINQISASHMPPRCAIKLWVAIRLYKAVLRGPKL